VYLYFEAGPARARLETAARNRGLPIIHLASELGIPRRTVCRIIAGSRIRWSTADRVAIALGHHPSELWPHWFEIGSTTSKETAS
jgi:lambda repressor-like predicted transcriptional regulator